MEVHKTKVKTKTKVWNQRMKDKNVVLHEIYTDFRDSDKKVPCSLKFKTDRIQEVIELHKVKFKLDTDLHLNEDGQDRDITVIWDSDPTQNGCIELLTLVDNSREGKKIFTMFFYQSGVILCQGEYIMFYRDFVFPQMMKDLLGVVPVPHNR